jgi:hypothetical protein
MSNVACIAGETVVRSPAGIGAGIDTALPV